MSWTVRPNDYHAQIDAPITQYNGYGIPLRDRYTDAFAYFPSEQYEYTGYVDRNDGDKNPGKEYFDDDTKKTQKLANNIYNQMKETKLSSVESQFIYAELLDSQALIAIRRLKKDIGQPWTVMKVKHINAIESRHGCRLVEIKSNLSKGDMKIKRRIERRLQKMYDLERGQESEICNLKSAHSLTDYSNYLNRILDHRIEIPDRFDISSAPPYSMNQSYLPVRLMARYYRRGDRNRPVDVSNLIDLTSIMLLDLHSVRSKTMFCFHICTPTRRDGITVIDQVSYSLNAVIHSPHLSQYLIYYGTTTNYSIYVLQNPLEATLYHLVYALLEPNLKRMVFYSPRHFLNAIEILATRTDVIKNLMLKAANATEEDLLGHIHESDHDDNCDDDESKSEKSKAKKLKPNTDTLERISHVFDVLYCIKNGYTTNRNIISECISDLWPKLAMVSCEIKGQDRLILRRLQNVLSAKHKGITIYSPIYAIPEAVIGYNIDCDPQNRYVVDPSQGYFEFLEVNNSYFRSNKIDLKAKSMRKLKKNSLYEVVVSSDHTDTIRQMTGEIVKIHGYVKSVPIISPVCREMELIYSYCQKQNDKSNRNLDENLSENLNENLSENDIMSKIVSPEDIDNIFIQSNLDVQEYCYRKVKTCYKFYLELHNFDYVTIEDEDSNLKRKRFEVIKSVKETRTQYRLSRLLIPDYDSKSAAINPNITSVEIRIIEPQTFSKIIKMREVESVDSNCIRISRRVVDEYEITVLKNAIVHQL